MKSHCLIALISTIVLAISARAEAKPVFKFGAGYAMVVAFPSGEPIPVPPMARFGLGVGVPVSKAWGWYTEVGVSVPNTVFHPSPRIFVGPTRKLTDVVGVSAVVLYQYNPGYQGKNSSHLVSPTAAVLFKVSDSMSLLGVMAVGKTVGGSWSVLFQPKLSFKLPF